jgi:serine/threonine protein kinase
MSDVSDPKPSHPDWATKILGSKVPAGATSLDTLRQGAASPPHLDVDFEAMGLTIKTIKEGAPLSDEPEDELELHSLRNCTRDYRVSKLLGRGGQGEVFEAEHRLMGRTVALKRAIGSTDQQRDFFKEAFTSAQLDHPNIVPVYELGMMQESNEPRPVLAMKKVEGVSWSELIRRDREWREVFFEEYMIRHLQILLQVINALAYAHSKGIIHRDLKPSQVMVGSYGEIFLLDWGLAVFLGRGADQEPPPAYLESRLFTPESISCPAGTPAYMAPEQTHFNAKALSKATDIYLVGAVLYELLTGRPPHAELDLAAALESARRNVFHPLPESTPIELAGLVDKCLETEPAHRPESLEDVRAAINDYLSGSGKKRESTRLVNEVARMGEFSSYPQVSDALRMLAQAEHLWPANPDVEEERQRLLTHFVQIAVAEEDFLLAQLQAERIDDPAVAAKLKASIAEARDLALKRIPRPPLFTGRRALVMAAICVLMIGAIGGMVMTARQTVYGEVRDKVRSLAALAAREIEATDLVAVDENPVVVSGEFQRVLNRLNAYRRANNDIRYISTLRPVEGNKWRTLVDADPMSIDTNLNAVIDPSEEGFGPGSLYTYGTEIMSETMRLREPLDELVNDNRGSFISGYAPIINRRSGEAMGLVRVDVKAGIVNNRLQMVNRGGLIVGLALLALVISTCLAWFNSRRTIELVGRMEEWLRTQSGNLKNKDIHLG